ncbi:hypothetical protein TPB0596_42770 [Tsukamurella pulmonis]|nr:hypothetical protein TPB0596_42770 [Tsukamurella pulmonis]
MQCFGERGDQQRGGGPVLSDDEAAAPADAGVAVGHRTARVLGAVDDLADPGVLGCQYEARGEALAEEEVHAVGPQAGGEDVGDGIGCGHRASIRSAVGTPSIFGSKNV